MSDKARFIGNLVIIITVVVISALVSHMHSYSLDLFPWGKNEAYTIWEPLLVYYLIPGTIILGLIKFFLFIRKQIFLRLSILICAFIFSVPSLLGFDLSTDIFARTFGSFSVFIVLALLVLDFYISRKLLD